MKEALVCRECCAAIPRSNEKTSCCHNSPLACLPKKQSSNPTPPGCCSAFATSLRHFRRAFRVINQQQAIGPDGLGPAAGLKCRSLSGSRLLLLALAKPVQNLYDVQHLALNTHAARSSVRNWTTHHTTVATRPGRTCHGYYERDV